MIFGLVLAGGIGRRMGSEIPKQYLKVGGKAIISYTVEQFARNRQLEKVIVLVPEDWVDYTEDLMKEDLREFIDRIDVTEGGEMRNDTIMNGIAYLEKSYSIDEETIVVTHDAVRPFVTQKIIDENIEALKTFTACDTVIPATDTIVESMDNEFISSIPDRSKLYQGQTPQSFRAETFKKLYNSLSDEDKIILTDAAKVFVIKGEKVALVEGASGNIKVTYPSDLELADSLLAGGKNK
ncbi:MAG: 2-C-methyl-D-erythritol 4-phosphate cytidylyltransferase [Eubacteriaceae bacterium]|jgi:2-C-methyl-D-erythritol 4-phosphate cytidylyltransferase|nr:2-C-methyl-D-erythritol 4-phosphate cytidylyltransferase [Eubacteriaceae bacterium]